MDITIGWALSNAVKMSGIELPLKEKDKTKLKDAALELIALFQEVRYEVNVCESCGGLASSIEPVINGLHPKCRNLEYNIKINNP